MHISTTVVYWYNVPLPKIWMTRFTGASVILKFTDPCISHSKVTGNLPQHIYAILFQKCWDLNPSLNKLYTIIRRLPVRLMLLVYIHVRLCCLTIHLTYKSVNTTCNLHRTVQLDIESCRHHLLVYWTKSFAVTFIIHFKPIVEIRRKLFADR